MSTFDVAVVGYGPTGMVLAALLGGQGHRVVVLDRFSGLYNLPRAGGFDDETMRTFQKLGLADEIGSETIPQHKYEWVNAAGQMLVEVGYDDPARGGWAAFNSFYQPHMENVLDRRCRSLPTIELRQGVRADHVNVVEDGVVVSGTAADGTSHRVAARFLIGCDGGSSFVRSVIGTALDSYDFEENWLVCDFRKHQDIETLPPLRQVCDPEQPIAIVQLGHQHHRFSFALNRDDVRDEVTRPAAVWARVRRYLGSDEADLVRVANYTFRSRVAEKWRDGSVLIAGDAAHEMPPFLGQGMCSGVRDAHNLAWKLDLVLSGRCDSAVLDTYQSEREPHVRAIIEKGIELGRVQTTRDRAVARRRDERLLALRAANQAPEKFEFPGLSAGLRAQDTPHAGAVFPQGLVRLIDRDEVLRFDTVVGEGPTIVSCVNAPVKLDPELQERWRELGGGLAFIELGDSSARLHSVTGSDDADCSLRGARLVDAGGTYARWFAEHPCQAVLVRPDWYLYGTVEYAPAVKDLAARFIRELRPISALPR